MYNKSSNTTGERIQIVGHEDNSREALAFDNCEGSSVVKDAASLYRPDHTMMLIENEHGSANISNDSTGLIGASILPFLINNNNNIKQQLQYDIQPPSFDVGSSLDATLLPHHQPRQQHIY
jgi:hypothetical protein